jgi:hypothetical protein
VYPAPPVAQFVSENFDAVRLHVRSHPEAMARFNAEWTPTVVLLDRSGTERHRIEGFLPTDDFLAQLQLGAAHIAFAEKRYEDAGRLFGEIVTQHGQNEAAPEAQYWAGVSRYKATNDASALQQTAAAFRERYSSSSWAKKASIWGGG